MLRALSTPQWILQGTRILSSRVTNTTIRIYKTLTTWLLHRDFLHSVLAEAANLIKDREKCHRTSTYQEWMTASHKYQLTCYSAPTTKLTNQRTTICLARVTSMSACSSSKMSIWRRSATRDLLLIWSRVSDRCQWIIRLPGSSCWMILFLGRTRGRRVSGGGSGQFFWGWGFLVGFWKLREGESWCY